MASERPPRRCTECGEVQRLTRATTDYPESGLDNVELVDVPVWFAATDTRKSRSRRPNSFTGFSSAS